MGAVDTNFVMHQAVFRFANGADILPSTPVVVP